MSSKQPQILILASASPRRLDLLSQIGIKPDKVQPAEIAETQKKREAPRAYVKRLAREKANAVGLNNQGAFILAADTVVTLGGRVLGKPENRNETAKFLKTLSGRRHDVITSVVLLKGEGISQKTVTTVVCFKRLTTEDINWYLRTGEWEGKAGGYAIQGHAGGFIKAVNGSYTNVVGLPLYETRCLLEGMGYKRKL